jgi:hypothetical protein
MTTRHAWPRATAWRSSPPALCVTLFSSLLCLCGGPGTTRARTFDRPRWLPACLRADRGRSARWRAASVAGATSTTAVPSSTPRPGALQDASMRGAFQVCTPENAAVHASFACEMNAGQLMSVPITFGILALFASGVIFSKVARDRCVVGVPCLCFRILRRKERSCRAPPRSETPVMVTRCLQIFAPDRGRACLERQRAAPAHRVAKGSRGIPRKGIIP